MTRKKSLFLAVLLILVHLCKTGLTPSNNRPDREQKECKRNISDAEGTITSPIYLPSYSNNVYCVWNFTTKPGNVIKLVFIEFQIGYFEECNDDYVAVYDGDLTESRTIGKFCGKNLPNPLVSSTNRLYMVFRTDEWSFVKRFLAKYIADKDLCMNNNGGCQHKCHNTIESFACSCNEGFILDENNHDCEVCKFKLTSDADKIFSPNFPYSYPNNTKCIWHISSTPGNVIKLAFDSFELKNQSNCLGEYVALYDRNSTMSLNLGRLCGKVLPDPVVSSSNELYVVFKSDDDTNIKRFSAHYSSETNLCLENNGGCKHKCLNTMTSHFCACDEGFVLDLNSRDCNSCSYKMNAIRDNITSPFLTNRYPSNIHCTWLITTMPLHVIKLFDFFGLNSQGENYVAFYDGNSTSSQNLGRFGAQSYRPEPIISSSNELFMVFKSVDKTTVKSRFTAHYKSDKNMCLENGGCQHKCYNTMDSRVCSCYDGFSLSVNKRDCKKVCYYKEMISNGITTNLSYPADYPSKFSCVWHFTTAPGNIVKLVFDELQINLQKGCLNDYILLYDGNFTTSRNLGRFCGRTVPPPIISTSNDLFMVYKSHREFNRNRFFAHYFSDKDRCMENNGGCQHKCHNTIDLPYCSCDEGFSLLENKRDCRTHCYYELVAPNASITSPNYPENYPSNAYCIWHITAMSGDKINLNFDDFFLQSDAECKDDYIVLYDGNSTASANLGRFCGSFTPPPIVSSANELFMVFNSNHAFSGKGFSAHSTLVKNRCMENNGGCQHNCHSMMDSHSCSCNEGFLLHEDNHTCKECEYQIPMVPAANITSPNFPDDYPSNANCSWRINTPHGHLIKLVFDQFYIGESFECTTDYLLLYDGNLRTASNPRHLCGFLPPDPMLSSTNIFKMVFTSSNDLKTRRKFSASFTSVKDQCVERNGGCRQKCQNTMDSVLCSCNEGFYLHENGYDCKDCKYETMASTGNISSPNYPGDYPGNALCVWHIVTNPGYIIKLVFDDFQLYYNEDCRYDYIMLHDGNSTASPILGRFCGTDTPYPKVPFTNELYMVFKTDYKYQLRGFSAHFISEKAESDSIDFTEEEAGTKGVTESDYMGSYSTKATTRAGVTMIDFNSSDPTKSSSQDSGTTSLPSWLLIVAFTVVCIFAVPIFGSLGFFIYKRLKKRKEGAIQRKKLDLQLRQLRLASNDVMTEFNPNYDSGGGKNNDLKHIPSGNLRLVEPLGRGAFGEVYRGMYKQLKAGNDVETPVAVKTLPERSTSEVEKDFLMEALIMNKFNHKNIVRLIGICFEKDLRFIVIELLAGGDLQAFLRESRATIERPSILSIQDLLTCAIDVARGCKYLEKNKFIHRDIAARNCLLTSKGPGRIVKIADFGMARNMYRTPYYKKGGNAVLPIRWMPPEAFLDGVFSFKTDVWSFGVLFWEVMSLGHMPFSDLTNQEVMSLISSGRRLQPPRNCPPEFYGIMASCWNTEPDDRPNFVTILERLEALMQNPDVIETSLPVSCDSTSTEQVIIIEKPPIRDCILPAESMPLPELLHDKDGTQINYSILSPGSLPDEDTSQLNDSIISLNSPPSSEDHAKLNYAILSSGYVTDEDGVQQYDSTPSPGLTIDNKCDYLNYSTLTPALLQEDDSIRPDDSKMSRVLYSPDKNRSKHENSKLAPSLVSSKDCTQLKCAVIPPGVFPDDDGIQLHHFMSSPTVVSNKDRACINYAILAPALISDEDCIDESIPPSGTPEEHIDSNDSILGSLSNKESIQPDDSVLLSNLPFVEDLIQPHD